MCAGSTKIAAPIVMLKMAAARPHTPMTRRRAVSVATGIGEVTPPKYRKAGPSLRARAARSAQDDNASFVLVHSPRQVIRHPGIEHPGATGHDVDVVGAHDPTGLSIGPAPPSSLFRHVGQFFRCPSFFPPLSLNRRACHPERARQCERRTCFSDPTHKQVPSLRSG